MKDKYYCYLLYSSSTNTTYTGITNDMEHRLKQHNGILKGGAKATRKAHDWKSIMIVEFLSLELASSFEWYAKRKKNNQGKWVRLNGLEARKERFQELLAEEKFGDMVLELF